MSAPLSIVQMFDRPFREVERRLNRLARLGVTHVLVSPPQASNPATQWWGRYQPVDFRVITGPLGDAEDLRRLCASAARRGMAVMADAVLNHMTNHPRWITVKGGAVVASRLERFAPAHFRRRPPRAGRHWLPELRTEDPYVQAELASYLASLMNIGVSGFRFDAAKHIAPSFFARVLPQLRPGLSFCEHVHGHAEEMPSATLELMQALDFAYARTLSEAFAPGGDLRALVAPEASGDALPGPRSIRFANLHDLARRRKAFAPFRHANLRDRRLAHIPILAGLHGTPHVYAPDLRYAELKAGLRFRQAVGYEPQRFVLATPGALIWTRGSRALAGVNKTGALWRSGPFAVGLEDGQYRDLLGHGRHRIHRGHWLKAEMKPRSACLLVRIA